MAIARAAGQTVASGGAISATAVMITFAQNVVATNMIGVAAQQNNGATSFTFADNLSPNVYQQDVFKHDTVGIESVAIGSCLNIVTGGACTITVTANGTTADTMGVVAEEYSGFSGGAVVDKTASNTGSTTSFDSGTTATTTAADELLFAVEGDSNNFIPVTYAGSFSKLAENATGRCGAADRIVAATGTYNATGTGSNPVAWAGAIATYKAAAAAVVPGAIIGATRIANKFVGPMAQRFLFRQPPQLDTTVAPPTSQAVMQRPAGTRLVGPPVLHRGLRAFTPLDTTTAPSAAVIVATVGSYTFAGKASGLSAQINAALGAYTWQGKASPLSTQIRGALGAYTWQGRTSPLSAQIGATQGAYSWQGRASPLSAQIGATVAPYTWHGVAGTVTTLPTINATVGAYAFSGSAAQVQGGADTTAGGPGGGGQQTYEEWLARHPWLRDYELRPNWYAYPPEKKKLRKQIVAAAKERKAVERRLSFAKDRSELDKLLEILNTLQERYNALQELYRAGLAVWQQSRAAEAEEEAEFMEHLINLL